MENTEKVIDTITEETRKFEDLGLGTKIAIMAFSGGVNQLADSSTYMLGIGVGMLFGKKAGFKTIGAVCAIGASIAAAQYLTGEVNMDDVSL